MKIEWDFRVAWVFIIVFFMVPPSGVVEAETESLHRTATAIRIDGAPPQLDGVLDDDIWKTAPNP